VNYFDDDLEKTAFFLDTLSRSDIEEKFIRRTQNYEMKSSAYIPSYTFKRLLSGNSSRLIDYPKIFRELKAATK
jgi:hypothetical protein